MSPTARADSSIHSIAPYAGASGKAGAALRAAAALLLALAAVLLAGCSREPSEQALRATIDRMQAAAEARDNDALMEGFAEDFAGPDGMDRDRFRRYLAILWMRNQQVGVTLGPLEVKVTGDRATVKFTAAARGGEGLLPDSAQVYRVDTGWRLDGGDWTLISASWEPSL